ncbi:MAG: DEAD/DEAH box helicase [Planctomycetes bacterium]|nr:DEAD/DEAH box helicase [Planctomycetota bacterium]
MPFAVGSLVRARGREWVVLPESAQAPELLVLRPLGGTEDEVTGIYLPLETVEPARFDLPDPAQVGDFRSCHLLRDAIRLGFRSSAGPFRSFARIAVEPRPYQLVPLLMALKLDPVRLLIADDVGIGKTVEAGLIARELLDRGEVQRLAVLCPPHLAEQWQTELRAKFHIDAEVVLPSTATRLERNCRVGQSLFDLHPHVIVSLDFIKTDRRRDEFLRTCPELVIVDEAHTCTWGQGGRSSRHQRHQLLSGLAADPDRHLLLVTATPHSGNATAHRSLLLLLNPDFGNLPEDLTGAENESHRRRLAAHYVQRRRGDIEHYLDADTPFPKREEAEETYKLSADYKKLFERVLAYARETIIDQSGPAAPAGARGHRQRVRWWSALALLRSLASSPAAAAATLRNRAASADAASPEEADEAGRRAVFDQEPEDSGEGVDVTPGGDMGEFADDETANQRRLREMAAAAEALQGAKDEKLKRVLRVVESVLKAGYHPILFCRFIPTAKYLAEQLRAKLPKDVEVADVTGALPPAEREERVAQLSKAKRRVLVATDCLSEGINLQDHFSAVVHYDLAWNPTRHEQRVGRVDRYGQPAKKVRALTYYGVDNQIDGIVLDVLIRKHDKIRNFLGVSVPVPINTDTVIEAILEGLLLRKGPDIGEQLLPGFEAVIKPHREALHAQWEQAKEREKRSRTVFAQETLKVEEVGRELVAVRAAIGSSVDVASFTQESLRAHGAVVEDSVVAATPTVRFGLAEASQALREALGSGDSIHARFELPVPEGVVHLSRTHPFVEGLAAHVMDSALDPLAAGIARRCGVIRTRKVQLRTTALLVRLRYHIVRVHEDGERPLLAEDCRLVAFVGSPRVAEWLPPAVAEELLTATPEANVQPDQASEFVRKVIEEFDALRPHLDEMARARGEELLDAHRRVRVASRLRGVRYRVEPQLPPDVLGVYIYLPIA